MQHTGKMLAPLLRNKIQYGKLLKDYNIDAVKNELIARSIVFAPNNGWRVMLNLLKANENLKDGSEAKYFTPLTKYDNFKWNSSHFEPTQL